MARVTQKDAENVLWKIEARMKDRGILPQSGKLDLQHGSGNSRRYVVVDDGPDRPQYGSTAQVIFNWLGSWHGVDEAHVALAALLAGLYAEDDERERQSRRNGES